eukprot:244031-Pyramimonas_sp.AAC.1
MAEVRIQSPSERCAGWTLSGFPNFAEELAADQLHVMEWFLRRKRSRLHARELAATQSIQRTRTPPTAVCSIRGRYGFSIIVFAFSKAVSKGITIAQGLMVLKRVCGCVESQPVFHDGVKEWSCCKAKSHDFGLFMDIKG